MRVRDVAPMDTCLCKQFNEAQGQSQWRRELITIPGVSGGTQSGEASVVTRCRRRKREEAISSDRVMEGSSDSLNNLM